MVTLTVNEALCFVFNHFSGGSTRNSLTVIRTYFTDQELIRAITVLHEVCVKIVDKD